MKTLNLSNAIELTEAQLRQVIGGDRRPPIRQAPTDDNGNGDQGGIQFDTRKR